MVIQRLDRQGRTIYFIEYANQTDSKGNQIELWEPEDIFLARDPTIKVWKHLALLLYIAACSCCGNLIVA